MANQTESLTCPNCACVVNSARTHDLPNDKVVTCRKCNQRSTLRQWRATPDDPAPSDTQPPSPLPSKLGPVSDLPDKSATDDNPEPLVAEPNPNAERIPCPSCAEQILPDATICPFCKQAVLTKNKATNAAAGLLLTVVTFFVLFYLISAFTRHEGKKEYNRIMKDSEAETERLMRDAERQAQEMMDRLNNR